MKILIIDDAQIWINQGQRLLESEGHEVQGYLVTEPRLLIEPDLPEGLIKQVEQVDLVVSDMDLGEGLTSTRMLCVLRGKFPKLPIIRWTGGYSRGHEMEWLRISTISKPVRKYEGKFPEEFAKMLAEQEMILRGPMAIFENFQEKESEEGSDKRRLSQRNDLRNIARLADEGYVMATNEDGTPERTYRGGQKMWALDGRDGGVMKHELGHAICDGLCTAEDIEPHLPKLQKVIKRIETENEIDERFSICAEFIRKGDLSELPLIRSCY